MIHKIPQFCFLDSTPVVPNKQANCTSLEYMMEPDAYNKGAKQQKSQDMKDRDDRDSHNKRSSFLVSEFSFDSQENEFDDWNLDEEHP